ncbi:MAG: 3-methyl-2-oxobutanoate dehydrogenase subunit beta [Deltaproteobacteria bacterium]|nr:3-methyl-2-oxobutanoate dehydrogenase subunit beta [Deltaproteobacteria bacterium]
MSRRVLMEGSCAMAEGAIQAGCRFYAGYPITPSTEILEYMSARLPQVGGVCMNAESEIEAIGMVWGAAGCGVRSMIASTGQGISLMQESFAELANAQIPIVAVNMGRGQGDYFQSTRGGGHGDYRFIVLAPSTAQEAVSLVQDAFHLADKWRNPVMLMGDFLLAHTSELVEIGTPSEAPLPAKDWATTGAKGRRGLTLSPLGPSEKLSTDIASALAQATDKVAKMRAAEQRVETGYLDDAALVVVAFGFPGRFVKYAVKLARAEGLRVGFVRPISLWPFPAQAVAEAAAKAESIAVFELNGGQMIEDVQLAVLGRVPVQFIGGISHDHSGFGVGPALRVEHILARIKDVYPRAAA